jgi:hypothetical protein
LRAVGLLLGVRVSWVRQEKPLGENRCSGFVSDPVTFSLTISDFRSGYAFCLSSTFSDQRWAPPWQLSECDFLTLSMKQHKICFREVSQKGWRISKDHHYMLLPWVTLALNLRFQNTIF